MTKYKYCFYPLLFLLLSIIPQYTTAEALYQVNINEDDILLLDVVLNNETVAQSIDAYRVDNKLMLAVEPLFDALNIRYKISKSSLSIWQDETEQRFSLNGDSQANFRWASDDFYLFTDLALFQLLFPAKMDYFPKRLKLSIKTPEKDLVFPFQKIKQQNKKRLLEQAVNNRGAVVQEQIPITISDEYQLFTLPHGRINIAAEKNNLNSGINTSIQLTSDFLYHSTELTLSDTNHTDLSARLNFSRYKTTPNDYIFGVYDIYQVGDISGQTNSLTTSTSAGLGVNFARRPEGYRPSNQSINLEETAPPGWEAELFHNNIFLEAVTVPADGLLVFENVETFYGQNTYLIKLYGPYGEEEVITRVINLTENALSKGEFAHNIYGLDSNHRLINDKSEKDYELTHYGASVDYGVSDIWQIGLGYTGLTNDLGVGNNKQFFNLKNAFTLPGLLLENDISFDQNGNHAQLTTLKGSAFEQDSFTLSFESAKDFQSGKVSAVGQQLTYQGSYSKSMGYTNLGFNATYSKDERREYFDTSVRLSGNVNLLNYNNTFNYTKTKNLLNNDLISNKRTDRFIGSFGLSGNLPYNFRVSGVIDYEPQADDVILDSSSIRIQNKFQDFWNATNYLTLDYLPLKHGQQTARWRFSHRVAWQAESYQLNLSSSYDENDNWSVQFGLQFFLSYDHRNNKVLFNDRLTSNTATLDVHTYLDRQLNGVNDPLDYNLSGVSFRGQPEWEGIKTSETGRIILPGVYASTPFSFSAKWKDGSSTINNDYVVYTHPGAYIDVNMPFILSTDISGFVLRTKGNDAVGLRNVIVELFNHKGELVNTQKSDQDGYYEFLALIPGNYLIRVAQKTLIEKSYTSDVIGFKVSTSKGGYVELPIIKLQKLYEDTIKSKERIDLVILNEDNTDVVVWDDDENVRKNYFTMPTKDDISAKHSLSRVEDEEDTKSTVKLAVTEKKSLPKATNNKFAFLSSGDIASGVLPSVSIRKPINQKNNKPETARQQAKSESIKDSNVLVTPFNKMTNKEAFYTIQLGAFSTKQDAELLMKKLDNTKLSLNDFNISKDPIKDIYRVSYGYFTTKVEANQFAKISFRKEQKHFIRQIKTQKIDRKMDRTKNNNNAWVIQLFSARKPLSESAMNNQFSKIGTLYSARKKTKNEDYLYCLISNSFSSKSDAKKALKDSGLAGWPVKRSSYNKIQVISN
ncbi:MAG: SPOR domain-containing protein [Colwellia sp.]|nr:SPOR domain-containing protein [Colwellia sp.]